ncbi:MAG: hypothetical protein ACD_46C00164G0004 [uncultured bacterium]|nr:MAG: hypothetical protein ACD_46C00164G0004 [uncultured bacterium]
MDTIPCVSLLAIPLKVSKDIEYTAFLDVALLLELPEIVKGEVARSIQIGLMSGEIDMLTRAAWATVHGTALLLIENQFPDNSNKLDPIRIAQETLTIVGRGLSLKK